MHLQSIARWAIRLSVLTLGMSAPVLMADENTDLLGKGVQSYEQGDYLGAQESLAKVKRDQLTESDKSRLDSFLQQVGHAIEMMEKAASDLEKADTQLGTGDTSEAKRLYQLVLDNAFAHEAMKNAASLGLAEISRRRAAEGTSGRAESHEVIATEVQPEPSEPAAMTVRKANFQPEESPADAARRLTKEAAEAASEGRDDVAEHLYRSALEAVPGYPEAVQGLESLGIRRGVEADRGGDLISRLRERDRVNWERAVSAYREAERETRELVLDGRFNLARQTLLRAAQIVESSKQYADPVSKYDTLRNELSALERYVDEEETRTEEDEVRSTRREVEKTEQARIQEVEDARRIEIETLLDQAMSLRKDGDYPGAIEMLEQVVAIDPSDQRAQALLDSWIDVYSLRRQREHRRDRGVQTQDLLRQVEADKIPINEELQYPKNWRDIVSRTDTRTATGLDRLSAEDVALQARLDERYAVNFDETPLEDVLSKMADDRHVNLNVVWNDLEAAGVERDAPVSIVLANEIPFRRALDEVLDVVGGGTVRLGYTAQNGVVKVASRTYLDREVYTGVYNITDLLQPLKNFTDGPTINLAEQQQGGGGGGGNFGQSTGQIFEEGEGQEEDDEDDAEREERVEEILELIRSTIQFDTWRENGGPVANIAEFNGQLVVTQTASAHQEIKDLLSQLREQSSIQVAVEAIFLQINSNYLEELGIDLDVVLNNGNAGFDQTGAVDNITGSQLLLPRSFSRVGFIPTTPNVGQTLTATGFTQTGGPVGVPGQPYNNPVFVPGQGTNFLSSNQTTPFPVQNNILDLVSPQGTDIEGSFGGSNFQPAINIFGSFLDNIQVDFLLRATQADRRSTVMSAPRVTMTNGQRSWVGVVTQEAYVATLQPVLDENAAAVQPIIGLIETGAVLDVESTVSADKHYVTMTLRPGVGRLVGDIPLFPFGLSAGGAGFAGFIQTPTVQRQILKTTVTVPDGGTLLFGGLKLAAEVEVDAGVPILSKIPVLKNLYSARSLVKDESVLLILVKPKIIIQREAERDAFPDLASR